MQLVAHPDGLRETDEIAAACQEDVLSVVNLDAVYLKRGGAPAEDAAALEERDLGSGGFERERGGEAGEAPADNGYALESHDRTTTLSFSVFESAARERRGSPGSRSIFLSSSS